MTQTQQRRPGRKPLAPEDRRRHGVTCRLTDAERDHVDTLRGSVTRGEWLRRAALSAPPRIVPELNQQAWLELSRLAANLNQLSRAVNEGRLERPLVDLAELRQQVQKLRQQLLGVEDES